MILQQNLDIIYFWRDFQHYHDRSKPERILEKFQKLSTNPTQDLNPNPLPSGRPQRRLRVGCFRGAKSVALPAEIVPYTRQPILAEP